jgi:hypothetical protein
MKLLLDENLPKKLKRDFPEYAIYPIAVIVLIAVKNTYQILSPLVPKIREQLEKPLGKGGIRVSL